jgi:hypothetical protein
MKNRSTYRVVARPKFSMTKISDRADRVSTVLWTWLTKAFAIIAAVSVVGMSAYILPDASASPIPSSPTARTFLPGAYIVDMGQTTQTEANGLKPYGLVYDLVINKRVPVSWAFRTRR